MRYPHSTRRGRNRLSSREAGKHNRAHNLNPMNRWPQLDYCRETNICFNRRVFVEPPPVPLLSSALVEDLEVLDPQGDGEKSEEPAKEDSEQMTLRNAATKKSALNGRAQVHAQGQDLKGIDLESAREKLIAKVEKHFFWSTKAARKMRLTIIERRKIYVIQLISFCERREIEWRYEPYKGGLVRTTPFRTLDLPGSERSLAVPPPSPLAEVERPYTFSGASKPARKNSMRLQSNSSSAEQPTTPSSTCSRFETISAAGSARPPSSADSEAVWQMDLGDQVRIKPFAAQVHTCQMPNSSFVKQCHGCQGRGRIRCKSCYGVGHEVCISCSGRGLTRNLSSSNSYSSNSSSNRSRGYSSRNSNLANGDADDYSGTGGSRTWRQDEPDSGSSSAWLSETCQTCHGSGNKRCWTCGGKSYVPCSACLGCGQLRCYQNLCISWSNHQNDLVLNNQSDEIIPRDKLRLSEGRLLVDEAGNRLGPLSSSRVPSCPPKCRAENEPDQLYESSKQLLNKHADTYRNERLLRQRQKLTEIDCHVVGFELGEKRGHFVIYGKEHKVHIANYPFNIFWNIFNS